MGVKPIFLISLFVITLYDTDLASVKCRNLESVSFQVGSIKGVELKSGEGLKSISGVGLGVFLRYKLGGEYKVSFLYDYSDLGVRQEDALSKWGWGFWDKFYGKYVDDLLTQDSVYAAEFSPVQRLYINSVYLMLEREFKTGLRFNLFLRMGCGIHVFQRSLVLKEHWFKHYPQIDYTFDFTFRNHAEPKKGIVGGFSIGSGIQTYILDPLSLEIGIDWSRIVPQAGRNFRGFPMRAFCKFFMVLSFYY
ncbi:MAG: hypothetical protein DRP91_04185 [Candidatus Neomarinimicrobiota bacterium]|nr:hypothetical protein [Candidatus Neomarinimicrobiota bacterium]RKY49486.1 MAG: hypothetical protein DRP91_04185 [Candidatus Neomarinimicrobiota bacterium]